MISFDKDTNPLALHALYPTIKPVTLVYADNAGYLFIITFKLVKNREIEFTDVVIEEKYKSINFQLANNEHALDVIRNLTLLGEL